MKKRSLPTRFITRLTLLALSVAAAVPLVACGTANTAATVRAQGAGAAQRAVPVSVAPATQRDVPVYLNGLGSVNAFQTVSVKTRIDGQLQRVAFREGQEVKQGDLLAVIDPRPYEVQLEQSRATLARDQAQLTNVQLDLNRYTGLLSSGIISRQQLDAQRSLVGQLEGAVRADQAAIESAKLNLVYTRIIAPVSGRIGLRLVDAGNMVHASDQNPLLVITQLEPIAMIFTLPEDELPTVAKSMRQNPLRVEAFSRDNQTHIASGKLLTIDNQIDPTTGTGRLKAVFENKERALWPNQFVNVRLLLQVRKNSIVIPTAAVERGPQGTFVYVSKPDNTVEARPVSIALTEGNLTAIENGVTAGENVVTDGQDKLQAGSRIEPRTGRSQGQGGSSSTTSAMAQ